MKNIEIIGKSIKVKDERLSIRIDFYLVSCRYDEICLFIGIKKALLRMEQASNPDLQLIGPSPSEVQVGDVRVRNKNTEALFQTISKNNPIQILYSYNGYIHGNPEHEIKINFSEPYFIIMDLLELSYLSHSLEKLSLFQEVFVKFFFHEWDLNLKTRYDWSSG